MAFFLYTLPMLLVGQHFELDSSINEVFNLENATGVSVADYDLDGDLDVFVVASEVFDKNDPKTWSRLLQNQGGSGFLDVTLDSKLINWDAETKDGTNGSKMGASWGDYDNDGDPDLFISNYGFDELWQNQGDGTFKNVTEQAGIEGCSFCYSVNGVWWDYDLDGDLDLYVSDWLWENRFYKNEGQGVFQEIASKTGLNDKGHTFSALPMDVDGDGLQDLYVINDIGENRFYKNQNNDRFEELTLQVGLSDNGNGMGLDVCDYDNDGRFDVYVTNIFEFVPNPFFVNQGNGTFSDQSKALGLDDTGWGWGARFFDADHDLDEDLYVVNGFDASIAQGDRNRFFSNLGNQFEDHSAQLELDSDTWGMGLEVFDYDLDGDLEMLVGNRGKTPDLYLNRSIELQQNVNWIKFELEGTTSNRNALGAVVRITCDGVNYYRYHSGVNLFGQSVKPVHFGLSSHQTVQEVQVTWPNGMIESFGQVNANQLINLVEGTGREVAEDIVLAVDDNRYERLRVYPNPVSSHVWLHLENDQPVYVEFSLMDMIGNLHFSKMFYLSGDEKLKVDLTGVVSSGAYLYRITSDNQVIQGKIIKR